MEEAEEISENGPIPKTDDISNSLGKSCALCGCSTPAVRCDRCNSQIFCLSCDDMYHRHPKRKLHLRKAVDSIWNTARSPRLRRRTDLPGDPSKIPIPPPRSKKRERHTIGGRLFMKPTHELGSFGHSKIDIKNIPKHSNDVFAGLKTPTGIEGTYENDGDLQKKNVENIPKGEEIYENENVPMDQGENVDNAGFVSRSPWNLQRTNISSPIQVSIPSSSPDLIANGQPFGYPTKQSRSIADLTGAPHSGFGHHPYHLPHYPYMHPPVHPPYSHSIGHLNCAQCLSSSWSNIMSPHPSPYFHPMPWGSAQGSLARGHPPPTSNGHMKHSHGDLPSYPDPNFHYPYPGAPYYGNGVPAVDPTFVRDLHQHADVSAVKKSPSGSRQALNTEDMETATDTAPDVATDTEERSHDAGSVNQEDPDEPAPLPEKPTEPWACAHCTFINPPGSHICQVCCKTSYGNKRSNTQKEVRPTDIRNSESPAELVNLDAISPPSFSKHKEAQKAEDLIGEDSLEIEDVSKEKFPGSMPDTPEPSVMLTTETQTSTSVKSTDVQTQNLICQTVASSTDSIFPKQEISVQTEEEPIVKNCSVATDPMISSQSMESLMSGVSAPPYHNRRAGWGRGASFSTQSLYERGRSRSPLPRSLSHEAHSFGRDSSLPPEEIMHSWSQAWLMSDPMYYKPHNLPGFGQTLVKEDYFDGTWGSMDKLNRRVKNKQGVKDEAMQRPRFHRSLDDLKAEKNQDLFHSHELQFLQTVKEAERCGFSLEDLHVAYLHCGKENPVFWLEDNWSSMIKNVIALAAKYGEDNEENDVGVVSAPEAKEALHIHRGDIWDAVTECIENRQRKILELTVRGNFTQKQIADALKNNNGNVELAYADLLRASSKRHKFILSPGMSEDSEDLTVYNTVEDGSAEHAVRASPLKTAKLDMLLETKTEKKEKKSDFLTKLSSIRKAQSERRKAREEKEMIRETITQDPLATNIASPQLDEDGSLKISISPQISDAKPLPDDIEEDVMEAEIELDLHIKDVEEKKDGDDNIPENYDPNWVEAQGEWIEEFSDEQWDEENDGQWVSLQKKYEKMEKEFEEEAREMAALWEKEELEDEVFEEESKDILHQTIDSEAERLKAEQEEKFQQWVKVNLEEKSLSEPEDVETNEPIISSSLVTDTVLSKSMEFDADIIHDSPLQHYATEFDLSSKIEDPDWVDLEPPSVEKQLTGAIPDAEEIATSRQDQESSVHELKDKDIADQEYSEGEWEKIDYEAELLELKEEETAAKTSEISRRYSAEVSLSKLQFEEEEERERAEFLKEELLAEMEIGILPIVESISLSPDFINESKPVLTGKEKSPDVTKEKSPDISRPRPPVRRKSKLNTSAVEEVLRNRPLDENVPPALPVKKNKSSEPSTTTDIYAVPDKHKIKKDAEDLSVSLQKSPEIARKLPTDDQSVEAPLPPKPPRLNLSPSRKVDSNETDNSKLLSVTRSKDGSPATSVSNESDSNCFADSESDPEIRTIRQKYMTRKAAKYENEEDDMFEDTVSALKQDDSNKTVSQHSVDLPAGTLQSMLREEFDFGPELPTPIGSRGSRVTESEVASPKAFREGTARPLQLFKASPAASFEAEEKDVSVTISEQEKLLQELGTRAETSKPLLEQILKPLVAEPEVNIEKSVYSDAQLAPLEMTDTYYYNTATELNQMSQQILNEPEASTKAFDPQYYNTVVSEPATKPNEIQGVEFYNQNAALYPEQESISLHQQSIPEEPIQMLKSEPSIPQDELAFVEMESASAADYFFGRYNEVVVSKPKKRTPIVKGTKPTAVGGPKMSASQVSVTPSASSPSQMTVSAAPVSCIGVDPSATSSQQPMNISQESTPETKSPSETKPVSISKTSQEITPEESLSFAEDYFFGSYNKVIVPKKVMIKPISVIPKPKSLEKLKTVEKRSLEVTSDKTPPVQPESDVESAFPDTTQSGLSASTPSGSLESIDESFYDACIFNGDEYVLASGSQQPLENIQFDTNNTDRKSDFKSKSVHFEESQPAVVPPPRKNKQKLESSRSSVSSYASAADDYSYHQYGESSQFVALDKKKLQPCSEDFKMKQGCDPSDFPSNSLSLPSEKQESAPSSEISLYAKDSYNLPEFYSKNDSFYDRTTEKSSDDFEFIELPASTDYGIVSENYRMSDMINTTPESTFVERRVEKNDHGLILSDIEDKMETLKERTTLDISEYAPYENIEKVADESREESTFYQSVFHSDQKASKEDLEDADSVQIDNDFDDELHLVEETQNLINEFCDSNFLESFEITPSNEMKSLNVKNNQDLSYDSEQEWKMNEERNNSLNANFIDNKLYGADLNSNHNIVEEDTSLIIDTNISVDTESGISESIPGMLRVALELSDFSEVGEIGVEDNETICSGTDIVSEFTDEKDSESIIKPLSVLCHAAASTFESIALSLQNISLAPEEDLPLEMQQVMEENAYDPGYSVSESLDALNEQSDDSLVTSTHSSMSTQIAVSSDVKIQDLDDEVSLNEKTIEATEEDSVAVGEFIPISVSSEEKTSYDAFKDKLECSLLKTETDFRMLDEEDPVELEPNNDNIDSDQALTSQSHDSFDELTAEQKSETYEENIFVQSNDNLSNNINISPGERNDLHFLKTMENDSGNDISTDTIAEPVVMEEMPPYAEKVEIVEEDKDIFEGSSSEAVAIRKHNEPNVTKYNIDLEEKVSNESATSENYGNLLQDSISEAKMDVEEDIVKNVSSETFATEKYCDSAEKSSYLTIVTETYSKSTENDSSEIVTEISDKCDETSVDNLEENIEESYGSLVSHFYDEWIENVKTTATLTTLQQDVRNLYTTYNYSGSSGGSSGNVSENEDVCELNLVKASDPVVPSAKSNENATKPRTDVLEIRTHEQELNVITMEPMMLLDVENEKETCLKIPDDLTGKISEESVKSTKLEEVIDIKQMKQELSNQSITEISCNEAEVSKIDGKINDLNDIHLKGQRISTSKSCQTDDSFEEDQFFDSFDDGFMDPSLLYFPVKSISMEPAKIEIGVQCCLVDTEIVTPSHDSSLIDDRGKIGIPPALEETHLEDWFGEPPDDIPSHTVDNVIPYSDSASKDSESASEATEDSDSDLFLEPHSSQEELAHGRRNSKARCHFLFAEVDSDTGFSSGSEYGVQISKKSYEEDSSTKSEKKQAVHVNYTTSGTLESQNLELSSSDVIVDQSDQKTSVLSDEVQDGESSFALTQNSAKIQTGTSVNQDRSANRADNKVLSDTAEGHNQPEDYLERAVTPIAIQRTPSIEDDLKFIEIKSDLEEQAISITVYEETMKPPTVEFFYGPLPQSVSDTLPDTNNELFVEALELLGSGATEAQKAFSETNNFTDPTEIVDEFENFTDPALSSEADEEILTDSFSEYFAVSDDVSISSVSSGNEKDGASVAAVSISDSSNRVISVASEKGKEKDLSNRSSVLDDPVVSDHSLEISKAAEDLENSEIFSDPISALHEDDNGGLTHSVSEDFAIAETHKSMSFKSQHEKFDVLKENEVKSLSYPCVPSALIETDKSNFKTDTFPEIVQSSCIDKISDVSEDVDNFSDPISSLLEDEEERLSESVSEYFAVPEAETSHSEFSSNKGSNTTHLKSVELSTSVSLTTCEPDKKDQNKLQNVVHQNLTDTSSELLPFTGDNLVHTSSLPVKTSPMETTVSSGIESDLLDKKLEKNINISEVFSTELKESFHSENQSDASSMQRILGVSEKILESVSIKESKGDLDLQEESDLHMQLKLPKCDSDQTDSLNLTISKEITQNKDKTLNNEVTSVSSMIISSQEENFELCDTLELHESVYSESMSEYLPPYISESFKGAVEATQISSENKDVPDSLLVEKDNLQVAETSSNKETYSEDIDSFQSLGTIMFHESSSAISNIERDPCVQSEPHQHLMENLSAISEASPEVLQQLHLAEETVSQEDFPLIPDSQNKSILYQEDSVKMKTDSCTNEILTRSLIEGSDSTEDKKLTNVATDIPSVPSDIVRYLYYDDSITFEEDSCISEDVHNLNDKVPLSSTADISLEINTFHSVDADLSSDVKPKMSVENVPSDLCEKREESIKIESKNVNKNIPSSKTDSKSVDLSSALQSAVISTEQFESMHSDLELNEQWFDLDVSKSNIASQEENFQESEHHTETKSATKEDSDFPCIPEMIMDKEIKVTHTESDEVTDISTHFTMTDDDSDKFSDIESDSSLNCFEEEGVFPLDKCTNEHLVCGINQNINEEVHRREITAENNLSAEVSKANVIEKEEGIEDKGNQVIVKDVKVTDVAHDVNGNYNELVKSSSSLESTENVLIQPNETHQSIVDSSNETADKDNEPCDPRKDTQEGEISNQSVDVIDKVCSHRMRDEFDTQPVNDLLDQPEVDVPDLVSHKSENMFDKCDPLQVSAEDVISTSPADLIEKIGSQPMEEASTETDTQCIAINESLTHFVIDKQEQFEREESSSQDQKSENSTASDGSVSFASLDTTANTFFDFSQTNNSYHISPVDTDADGESITETEDLEYLLPDSKANDKVSPLTMQDPSFSISIDSESSMKVQDTNDIIESVPKVEKEELEPCVPKEISDESEVIIPVDTVSLPLVLEEKISVKCDADNLDKSDCFEMHADNVTEKYDIPDQEIYVSKPVMSVPDECSQGMSLDIYETKEIETDAFPKSVEVMPSDVDGAECSLNFGNTIGAPALEQEACSEDTLDSSAQIKMNSISERKHAESDFVSIPSAESLLASEGDIISQNIVSSQADELFKGVTVGTVYENVQAFDSKVEMNSVQPLESNIISTTDYESKALHSTSDSEQTIGPTVQGVSHSELEKIETYKTEVMEPIVDVNPIQALDEKVPISDSFRYEDPVVKSNLYKDVTPELDDMCKNVSKVEDKPGIKEPELTLEFDQDISEVEDSLSKEELTDISYKSLSDDSDNWFEEDSGTSIEDTVDDFIPKQGALVISTKNISEQLTEKVSTCKAVDTSISIKDSQPIELQDQNKECLEGNEDLIDKPASNFVDSTGDLTKLKNESANDESEAISYSENEQVVDNFIEMNSDSSEFITADSTLHQLSGMDPHLCSEAESSNFYSLSEDIDDTLNISSDEDFTDVPSHMTLTENSEMWSDVESVSVEFDDLEQPFMIEKDKTPTRDEDFCNFKLDLDDEADYRIISESSIQNYGVDCSFSSKNDAQLVPELKHEFISDKSIPCSQSKAENVPLFESTNNAISDYENNNVNSSESVRQAELLQMNTDEAQPVLEIKEEIISDVSIPCSPSKDENLPPFESTTNVSSDYENNNMDYPERQVELSHINEIMEDTESLQQECKISQQIVDSAELTSEVSGISESHVNVISLKEKDNAEKEYEKLEASIPQLSSNDAIIEHGIEDALPDDSADESTASFNTITDECERWSDSEATNPLEDFIPPLEKEKVPLTEMNVIGSIVPILNEPKSEDKILESGDIEDESTKTQFANFPSTEEYVQTELHTIQHLNEQPVTESVALKSSSDEIHSAVVMETALTEHLNERESIKVSKYLPSCIPTDDLTKEIPITEDVSSTTTDGVLKPDNSDLMFQATDAVSDKKREEDSKQEKKYELSQSDSEAKFETEESVKVIHPENRANAGDTDPFKSEEKFEAKGPAELLDSFEKSEMSSKSISETVSNDSSSEKLSKTEIANERESDKNVSKMEVSEQSTDSRFGLIFTQNNVQSTEVESLSEAQLSFEKAEKSEISSDSVFESISKDYSEQASDLETESYEELENDRDQEKKSELKSADSVLDAAPEPMLLSDGKKLSLSMANIIESSDLNVEGGITAESQLLEHFADIKSLSEQLALVETFPVFDSETAVPKMHDTGETSVCLEKTENSDYGLETETDYSISEFEDDAVSLSDIEKAESHFTGAVEATSISEDKRKVFKTASQKSTDNTTDISVSFHTDTDYSDQVSDTCADISLQGATTENSDKWSDIEGDVAIEGVYDERLSLEPDCESLNTALDIALQMESGSINVDHKIDSTKKCFEFVQNLDLKITTDITEANTEVLLVSQKPNVTPKIEEQSHPSSSEVIRDKKLCLDVCDRSKKPSSSSDKKNLSERIVSSITASGLSDDEFTNVTPLDVTTGDSDKWSDLSDDTSIEEMLDDSKSYSLKTDNISHPIVPDQSVDATVAAKDISFYANNECGVITETKHPEQSMASDPSVNIGHPPNQTVNKDTSADFNLHQQSKSDITFSHVGSQEVEVSTEIADKSINVSNIPSIENTSASLPLQIGPASTLEAMSEPDVIESQNLGVDALGMDELTFESDQDVSTPVSQNLNESPCDDDVYEHENLEHEMYFEDGEELDPNFEGHEMDYEDEYPDVSEPFIINDDELVYPLQYEDWIEESFDLKEYGIEAVFSESETDVHELFMHAEDDEDIQRAIDFNINNFEEAMEGTMDDKTLNTDSFKTLSNNPSQSKTSEKEHDSWSTADADSIEDDLSEHDKVLSKIDELLAEDFAYGDDYYKDDYNDDGKNYESEEFAKTFDSEMEIIEAQDKSIPDSTTKSISFKDTWEESEKLLGVIPELSDENAMLHEDSGEGKQVLETFESTVFTAEEPLTDLVMGDKVHESNLKALKPETELKVSKMNDKEMHPIEITSEDHTGKVISQPMEITSEDHTIAIIESSKSEVQQRIDVDSVKPLEVSSSELIPKSEKLVEKTATNASTDESSSFTIQNQKTLDYNVQLEETVDNSKTNSSKNVTASAEKTISVLSTKPEETKEPVSSIADAKEGVFEVRRRKRPSLQANGDSSKSVDESQVEGIVNIRKIDTSKEEKTLSEYSTKTEETKKIATAETEVKEGGVEVKRRKRPSLSTTESVDESCFSARRGRNSIPSEEQNQCLTLRVRKRSVPQVTKTEESPLLQTSSKTVEAEETKSDIPCDQKFAVNLKEQTAISDEIKASSSEPQSVNLNISSEERTELDLKPDIPEKNKRGSLSKIGKISESQDLTSEAPSLPPKKSKRKSSSDSTSSFSSLSSSSESLSYESASLKSDSISTKETVKTSESIPDVPARKAKLKPSFSSSRKDSSDDSSSSASTSSRHSSGSLPKESEALSRKRASIDEQMIKLQNEGKCSTKEKAFIAAKLIEMQFEEQDALLASRQCSSVYHAVKFLTQLCELCNCRFPINLMSSMVYCTHRACKECLKAHFTTLIYDRSIFTLLCPICHKPDITDQNIQEYFNHLDMMFRNILDSSVYDLFQRKLRDEVLTKDPNFHWCSQCSSGFIASPRLKKLYCPDCSAITCSSCHQTWELEHEGVHCERFQQWKDMHTPEPPPAGSVKFLADRGITCPSCGIVYAQASGGCLMYKCSHCSFEFCGFCTKPCKRGKDCANKSCESLGIHAHHSFSCLFFLRDKDVSELQLLLEEESVTYLTIPPKDQIVKSRCQVREQKLIHGNISEDRCGRDIVPYCAGLCRTHYYEYLTELIRKNKINPLPIMTTQDLQFMFRKCRMNVEEKVKGETNEEYYNRLTKIVSNTLT